MPKVDLAAHPLVSRTGYPAPHDAAVAGRHVARLGPAAGLGDFGVSHVRLDPGAWSSQRHWHEAEDEVVVMLEGEAVLVEEDARTMLRAGDIATFAKGVANGHHLVNESDRPARFLAFGRVPAGACHYPDIDLAFSLATGFTRRDGSSF